MCCAQFAVSGDRVLVDDEDDSAGPGSGTAAGPSAGAAGATSMDVDGQEGTRTNVLYMYLLPAWSTLDRASLDGVYWDFCSFFC